MNRLDLINIIEDFLKKVNYKRNDNYKTYSVQELLMCCQIYGIAIKFN
jgi:hypothetical protein